MLEKIKDNKIALGIFILLLIAICIGISYAYWLVTRTQTGENAILSSCLKIELVSENEAISIPDAYPISDEEGMSSTPYTFTIKNTCDSFISYEVILGMLNTTTLNSKYLNAVLDYNAIQTLNQYEETNLEGYKEGRILQKGSLSSGDEVTYNLRMWLDEDVTYEDKEAMNKNFEAKIVVTAVISNYSPIEQGFNTLADAMLVNEYQSSSVESAKEQIKKKQTPDFTQTAPIIIWDEVHANTTSAPTTNTSQYIGTSYEFNSETGYYYIRNYGSSSDYKNYTDISNEEYASGNYYTCVGSMSYNDQGNPNYWRPTNCTTMYKILSAEEYQSGSETRWRITAYAYTQSERESDKSDRGLYVGTDADGETYYYRGSVTNNYVYFANAYWRIIRLNGDGSVRLLYAGTTPNATGSGLSIGISSFNSTRNSPAYVGFMYGNTINQSYELNIKNEKDSTIKTKLDSWYKTNIVDKGLSSYIADSGFCNDRSITSGDGVSLTSTTYYRPHQRYTNHTPSLLCPNQNDLFTVENTKGNQALTYPIGLITSDELAYAGMSYGYLNRLVYTYSSQNYWSLSPFNFYSGGSSARVWIVFGAGYLDDYGVTGSIGVRPVINLNGNVEISSGIGTSSDPYVVKTT